MTSQPTLSAILASLLDAQNKALYLAAKDGSGRVVITTDTGRAEVYVPTPAAGVLITVYPTDRPEKHFNAMGFAAAARYLCGYATA